ncbi:prephenate dehydratase [Lawsonella clevelandensis]|uniref:Prephenate dehydratase n=1 Tax=Lawsonella clevelandensis TaxID=1528099 RepID=A0A0M5L3R4_9ACTN|nr:prephenate dehydratase [Lawsonella clevelandensis]ALE18992.1 prephenate dehydratase [Lawsonella clevelandensis]ALE34641.1 prephenate dehydratase [Lawsonella clevelandensis]MDU7193106.1 prephenate dehydratase [Lawsonella clevelandensis]VHO00522.1 Prephenate dehydratase [Lawsonella clevelandensis]
MTSISFLGPVGTFSEAALRQIIADKPLPVLQEVEQAIPAATPQEALQMVRDGAADFALVPTENFVDGPVTTTLDSLARGDRLQIFAETEVPVVFSLLVREGTELHDIHTVGSHPVALAQVRQWSEHYLPGVGTVITNSTAAAAEDVVRGRLDAAVAPARAGEILGLVSLAAGIADVQGAYTRFILVGKPAAPTPRTGADRTSVVFRLPNKPGTLVNAMNEFGLRGVDLSRIESRPTREKFGTYNFYIDCVGHIDDAAVAETLQALYRRAEWVRYLGSWPAYRDGGSMPPDFQPSLEWVEQLRRGDNA